MGKTPLYPQSLSLCDHQPRPGSKGEMTCDRRIHSHTTRRAAHIHQNTQPHDLTGRSAKTKPRTERPLLRRAGRRDRRHRQYQPGKPRLLMAGSGKWRDSMKPWKTTIIISACLQNHEAALSLSAQQHRVRYSDSVERGTFIFPRSGIAFMIVDTQQFPEEAGLLEQIKKFIHVHRNGFLLLLASLHGEKQWGILSSIQQRFLGSNLRVLPVHNIAEIVKSMLTIAKATSKPHVDSVRDRMTLARAQIIERSPVWEVLRKLQLDCE
ncbi:protein SPO16 homolog [Amia ocellicauda]|uniref:protein SPO16 homolog n=1 Tax=Amia ocellicauda TaxID=2972642 RepID=UPI003463E3F7